MVDGNRSLGHDGWTAKDRIRHEGPIRTVFVSSAIAASAIQPSNHGSEVARV